MPMINPIKNPILMTYTKDGCAISINGCRHRQYNRLLSSNSDLVCCIYFCTNDLRKGMNPPIPPGIVKMQDRLGPLDLSGN